MTEQNSVQNVQNMPSTHLETVALEKSDLEGKKVHEEWWKTEGIHQRFGV